MTKMKSETTIMLAIVAPAALTIMGGCTSVRQTLDREKQALVKMPVAVEPEFGRQRHANGLIFQQAFAAPTIGRQPATWFLVWREKDQKPLLGDRLHGMEDIAKAAHACWNRYPILVEENFTFKVTGRRWDWKRRHPGEPVPDYDPLWHLGDDYSQLRSARAMARLSPGANPIRIGHLDNGFTAGHVGTPVNMFSDSWVANCPGLDGVVESGHFKNHDSPGQTHGTHGTGTLGILAGRPVRMPPATLRGMHIGRIDEAIGGAPEAKVVSIRIAPWVGSLSSAEMAYGIDLASRVHGCEVITMSHGGLPTVAWSDAINAAYERGTAIFAAESDFFSLVPRPFHPYWFVWPSSPVWPAAFRRVIGVTGVQKDGVTYAKNGGIPLTGFMRGSYGPDGARNFGLQDNNSVDAETVLYGGKLRAYPIAAYAPNIVWPEVRKDKAGGKLYLDGLAFDGAGTSSATPQVAAAAALWLQKHRKGFTNAEWNWWRRAEAVYYALLASADRSASNEHVDRYLGAGILKAKDALEITPRKAMSATKDKSGPGAELYFPRRISKVGKHDNGMASDYADGERSLRTFLGLVVADQSRQPVGQRKNLDDKVGSYVAERG